MSNPWFPVLGMRALLFAQASAAIACAAAPQPRASTGDATAISPEIVAALPVPDGVAEPGGEKLYVTDVSGEIVALETSTGREVWRLPGGARPLVRVGDRLVVARFGEAGHPTLSVGIVSARDGAVRRWAEAARLPVGIWSVAGPVRVESDTLVLPWQTIREAPPSGMRLTEEMYRQRHDPHAGVARARLAEGGVDLGDGAEDPVPASVSATHRAINQDQGTAPWFMAGPITGVLWHENRDGAPWAMVRAFDASGRERFTKAMPDAGGGIVYSYALGAGIVLRQCAAAVSPATCRYVAFEAETGRALPDVPATIITALADGLGRDNELAWTGGVYLVAELRIDAAPGARVVAPAANRGDETLHARRFLVAYDPTTWKARWEREIRPFHRVFYAPRP